MYRGLYMVPIIEIIGHIMSYMGIMEKKIETTIL